MSDEPTLGEIGRGLENLRKAVDRLGEKVLTVEVWRVERESIEQRFKVIEDDVRELQTERKADATKAENKRWMTYIALGGAIFSFLGSLYLASRPGP